MAKTTSQLSSIYLLHQEQVWLSFPGWMDGWMDVISPCPPFLLRVTNLLAIRAYHLHTPSLQQPGVLKRAHHLTEGPSTLTTLWTQPLTSRREEGREGKGVGRKGKGKRERKGATFPQMAHSISKFISHFSRADIKPRMYKHS